MSDDKKKIKVPKIQKENGESFIILRNKKLFIDDIIKKINESRKKRGLRKIKNISQKTLKKYLAEYIKYATTTSLTSGKKSTTKIKPSGLKITKRKTYLRGLSARQNRENLEAERKKLEDFRKKYISNQAEKKAREIFIGYHYKEHELDQLRKWAIDFKYYDDFVEDWGAETISRLLFDNRYPKSIEEYNKLILEAKNGEPNIFTENLSTEEIKNLQVLPKLSAEEIAKIRALNEMTNRHGDIMTEKDVEDLLEEDKADVEKKLEEAKEAVSEIKEDKKKLNIEKKSDDQDFEQLMDDFEKIKDAVDEIETALPEPPPEQEGGMMTEDKDALSTKQIDQIMSRYPEYYGTHAKDEFYKVIPNIPEKSKGGVILNLDDHTEPGSHWVAVYWDDGSIEYYDSLGRPPIEGIKKDLNLLNRKLNPGRYLKFKENKIRRQSKSSVSCGYFAMNFLMERFRGKSFKQSTGYNQIAKNEDKMDRLHKKFEYLI